MIGIKLMPFNNKLNNVKLGPTEAIFYSAKEVWFVSTTSIKYLLSMIIGSGDTSQLGGPIRIAKITGQVAEYGIIPFFKRNGLYIYKSRFNKLISYSNARWWSSDVLLL